MMQIPILSLNKIQVAYNGKQVLKVNNFDIHRGAAYFVNGNMACGKSTLLNIIAKKNTSFKGDVLYENEDLSKMSTKSFSKNISYVEQSFRTPWGNVRKFLYKHLNRYHHINNIDDKIKTIVRKMDIEHLLDVKMSKLTPGQLRWVVLSANIAADTKILIIDEVEQHLSSYHIKILNKILYRKCNYDGVTLIASTQNKSFFQSHLASVIITLEKGKIYSVRSSSHKKKRN